MAEMRTGYAVAAILLAATMVAPGSARAERASVGLTLTWKGDQPSGVALGNVYPPTNLRLNSDRTAFSAEYRLPSEEAYLSSISLDATYGDGATLSVPLRVWRQLSGVATTVYQVKLTACSPSALQAAESAAGTPQGALKSFFTARALYQLDTDDKCSLNNRRRAAKAWFDRAYELTTLANYFDLSSEAGAAYANYDAAYVKRFQDQAKGAALRLVNDAKKKALEHRDYELAASLNGGLLNSVKTNEDVRSIAHKLQGLTEDSLRLDGDHIAGRAAAAGVTATAGAASLDLAPKAIAVSAPSESNR